MSGLIDIWCTEVARYRERNRVVFSSEKSGPVEGDVRPKKAQEVSGNKGTFLDQVLKKNPFDNVKLDSDEIALSVLVDCFW